MRRVFALLLAALLAPLASAGTERDPDVPGVPDRDDKTLDFLAAWFESAPDGLVFTVKIASAEKIPVNKLYGVSFTLEGARISAAVVMDEKGQARNHLGAPNWDSYGVDPPAQLDGPLEDVRFTTGTPAYATARIPWDALAGLGPEKVLVDLAAGTGRYGAGGYADVDGRETSNTYVIEKTYLPLVVQRNPTWFVAGFVLLGIAVSGAIVWYRRRSGQ